MHIVADDAIPWLHEAFDGFGKVCPVRAGSIDRDAVSRADVLLTRSVTRVDADLLVGSSVRFVGSTTAGIDHVSEGALRSLGIEFAHAPGCNANAVVEYVMTALALAVERDSTLAEGPVGLVGFGQVGSRLASRLRSLGREVMACDPPRREAGLEAMGTERLHPLELVLDACRVVTLHVPLTRAERHGTFGLMGSSALERLQKGSLIVNTSRGAVVDGAALERWLAAGHGYAVLDVWENEPALRWSLLDEERLLIATPHIAGYTLEGKVGGTQQVHDAVAKFSRRRPFFDARAILGMPGSQPLLQTPSSALDLLLFAHPLQAIDAELRALRHVAPERRTAAFEAMRRGYRLRRELAHYALPGDTAPALRDLARRLAGAV